MYGDPDAIRGLARQLRDRADEIRSQAARLSTSATDVPWEGCTADAMRHHLHDQVRALFRTASLHDDAADALDRHAREVQRLQDLIAAIEHRALHLVAAARDRIADLGHSIIDGITGAVADPRDELLDRFVPPPPGSRDWLTVDLPGLR